MDSEYSKIEKRIDSKDYKNVSEDLNKMKTAEGELRNTLGLSDFKASNIIKGVLDKI